MIKVGLLLQLRGMWRGGIVYYKNLLECYQDHPDPDVQLEVFTDQPEDLAKFQCDRLNVNPSPELLQGGIWNWPRRKLRRHVKTRLGYDPVLLRLMERNQIDLLSHIGLGSQISVKTLPWQSDFQHKVFPHFFSSDECAGRDLEISKAVLWGNILLSSQDAANSFRRYYPEMVSVQTHVLPFPSITSLSVNIISRLELEKTYPIQSPYFFLPNQFWTHKNHKVVLEALHLTPPEIRVVCTGLMEDRRNPSYVPELLDTVRQYCLEERFICLGELPYRTMISLMQHSLSVLQPSLFEGWSTTVEEAKALGVRIILSNLDVHKEQAPNKGVYFDPNSPEDLATCMKVVYAEPDSIRVERRLDERFEYRARVVRQFSEDFARILKVASGTST
jgi:glycosyltransferase involved in cell wall biosynthesis